MRHTSIHSHTYPSFASFIHLACAKVVHSPLWPNVSECRHEMKAARAAGQVMDEPMFVKFLLCEMCTIGIGPEQHEKELYLYPTSGRKLWLGNLRVHTKETTILYICGGCARHHHFEGMRQVISAADWKKNALLIITQEKEILAEKDQEEQKAFVLSTLISEMLFLVNSELGRMSLELFGGQSKGKGQKFGERRRKSQDQEEQKTSIIDLSTRRSKKSSFSFPAYSESYHLPTSLFG